MRLVAAFLAINLVPSGSVLADPVQLPIDASNCAIFNALNTHFTQGCSTIRTKERLGTPRGIVLRLDQELERQNAEDKSIAAPVKPLKSRDAQTPKKAAFAPKKQSQPKSVAKNRGAAKNSSGYFIQFSFGSFELEPEFEDHILRLGTVLRSRAMAATCIRVTGHTDSVGSEAFNLNLSKKRAIIVATMLAEKGGVNPERIQIAAVGESKPLPEIPNDDPLNRRVEFATKESVNGCNA